MGLPRWAQGSFSVTIALRRVADEPLKQVFTRYFQSEDEAEDWRADELDTERYEPWVECVVLVHRVELTATYHEVRP